MPGRGTVTAAFVAGTLGTLTAGTATAADRHPVATLVLHVANRAQVPAAVLADAEATAAEAYAHAGVRLVWEDGLTDVWAAGPTHFNISILDAAMTANKAPAPGALGRASRETRLAYVFYGRVVTQAIRSTSAPSRTLGHVLAHEIGHLLLPGDGHAAFGLMRPDCDGRISRVLDFEPAQAATIRTLLTSAK
jgi:hypothetical protein